MSKLLRGICDTCSDCGCSDVPGIPVGGAVVAVAVTSPNKSPSNNPPASDDNDYQGFNSLV